jgi:hypothetical protein
MTEKNKDILKQIIVDEKDSRFLKLKEELLLELKENIICEDYEPILNYVFEVMSKDDSEIESEFKELFEEKANHLLDHLISLVEKIYKINNEKITLKFPNNQIRLKDEKLNNKEDEKDILDEFYEDKANKDDRNNMNNFRGGFNNDRNFALNPEDGNYYQKRNNKYSKQEFNLGGKNIVLKGGKKDENSQQQNKYQNYRDRSRDTEGFNSQNVPNHYNNYPDYDYNMKMDTRNPYGYPPNMAHNQGNMMQPHYNPNYKGRGGGMIPPMHSQNSMFPNQSMRGGYQPMRGGYQGMRGGARGGYHPGGFPMNSYGQPPYGQAPHLGNTGAKSFNIKPYQKNEIE